MSGDAEYGRELIKTHGARSPVVRLARSVAMAMRVEPAILRAARLKLAPDLDTGAESDLWFSNLVGSRSSRAITLEHDVLVVLREELKNLEHDWLYAARQIVAALHANEAPSVRLEEEVIWLAIEGGPNAPTRIEAALRRAVKAMHSDDRRGMAVARWADRALLALPKTALQTDAARLLALGSNARLGQNSRAKAGSIVQGLVQQASWIVPEQAGTTELGLRLGDGYVELTDAGVAGSTLLELSGTDATLLEFHWESDDGDQNKTVAATAGNLVELPQGCREFVIQTVSGKQYKISAGEAYFFVHFSPRADSEIATLDKGLRTNVDKAIEAVAASPMTTGVPVEKSLVNRLYQSPDYNEPILYTVDTDSQPAFVLIESIRQEQTTRSPTEYALALADVLNAIALGFHTRFRGMKLKIRDDDEYWSSLAELDQGQYQLMRGENEAIYLRAVQDALQPPWKIKKQEVMKEFPDLDLGEQFSDFVLACIEKVTQIFREQSLEKPLRLRLEPEYVRPLLETLISLGVQVVQPSKDKFDRFELKISQESFHETLTVLARELSSHLSSYDNVNSTLSKAPVDDAVDVEARVVVVGNIIEEAVGFQSSLAYAWRSWFEYMRPYWRRTRDKYSDNGIKGFTKDQHMMDFLNINSRYLNRILASLMERNTSGDYKSSYPIEPTTAKILREQFTHLGFENKFESGRGKWSIPSSEVIDLLDWADKELHMTLVELFPVYATSSTQPLVE